MTPADANLVEALVHHANVILLGDNPRDNLADAKGALRLAEKILNGTASNEERQSVGDVVHPQVRSLYGL